MLKVVKVRLYPNSQQQEALSQSFGNCRWLWNYCLNLMNQTYKETGKGLSGYEIKKLIPQLKKEYEWLSLAYSSCLQQVCLNLGGAFNNFFEHRTKYPRFKSKHGKQSIQYPQNVRVLSDYLTIPKIGDIKAVIHRPIEGKIKTVTISKNCCDQYFASILFEDGKEKPLSSTGGKAVGVDVGLTHFCTTSSGLKYENPRFLTKHEKNLKRKQQQLSKKEKGSNNRNKARKKVARVHRKITNCREDFLHKLSRRIVDENQVIVTENLNVKGMMKNHCLAKAIGQVGWGMFMTMLKYKAEQNGKTYVEVDRFFPSSKTCHVCLNQVGSLPLDIRRWTCQSCNTTHDRDINAAISLRDEGLRIISCGTRDKAYRQTVRRSSRGRKKSTTTLVSG
ncbi:RNA-guided endonuclease TnpB family protein [Okeania sp. SIO2B3]|uniref:RNA-guided endonuclease InsQ/TnpB family protein n=1 Tax=Okeania sp. SIO2B3 TaxID=2607784 RepID=UPI0013C16FDA|nr:RNA-guided endonuclease TnpB family protein [Okeania sp. SIO2B3]NET42591.1 IS200/IS605 family element transposase accessory protein TnpB [Okeania sp. SIO2B3]